MSLVQTQPALGPGSHRQTWFFPGYQAGDIHVYITGGSLDYAVFEIPRTGQVFKILIKKKNIELMGFYFLFFNLNFFSKYPEELVVL